MTEPTDNPRVVGYLQTGLMRGVLIVRGNGILRRPTVNLHKVCEKPEEARDYYEIEEIAALAKLCDRIVAEACLMQSVMFPQPEKSDGNDEAKPT